MNMKELHTRRIQKPIVLPPTVIAFKVLDSSDIDTQDSLIMLTGVIYQSQEDALIVQMKNALLKYYGEYVLYTQSVITG